MGVPNRSCFAEAKAHLTLSFTTTIIDQSNMERRGFAFFLYLWFPLCTRRCPRESMRLRSFAEGYDDQQKDGRSAVFLDRRGALRLRGTGSLAGRSPRSNPNPPRRARAAPQRLRHRTPGGREKAGRRSGGPLPAERAGGRARRYPRLPKRPLRHEGRKDLDGLTHNEGPCSRPRLLRLLGAEEGGRGRFRQEQHAGVRLRICTPRLRAV